MLCEKCEGRGEIDEEYYNAISGIAEQLRENFDRQIIKDIKRLAKEKESNESK